MLTLRNTLPIIIAVTFVTILSYARLSNDNETLVNQKYQYTSNVELLDARALVRCVSTNLNGSQEEIHDIPVETEWTLINAGKSTAPVLDITFEKTPATSTDWWRVLKDCSYHLELLVDDYQGFASRKNGISTFRLPIKIEINQKAQAIIAECYSQGCQATFK